MPKKIGVLALQGGVAEHIEKIKQVGALACRVRSMSEIATLDGLILPGGESTAMGKLLRYFNMLNDLRELIKKGLPVWGTCAGLILLAREVEGGITHLGVMDMKVCRNAYGSQLDSFSCEQVIKEFSPDMQELVFIRAPIIEGVSGKTKIIAETDGKITAAKEENMLATSFHPELAAGTSVHDYFINKMC